MSKYQFNLVTIIALILFGFGEVVLLFFTPRTETAQLFTLYFGLFAAYMVMCNEVRNIRTAAFIGILTRCLAWLAMPTLSDDIYRFIWDGSVSLEGINPYLATPSAFLKDYPSEPFSTLFPLLNSADYFSVYPLVIQVISAFGALVANDLYLASLIIKLPILLAEIGILWMLPRLMVQLNLNPKLSLWYFLNPLIIVELTGNAHFEGLMIFFTLIAIKMIVLKKYKRGALALALGVATKLIPLLLFPFLLKALPKKARIPFTIVFIVGCLALFAPLLNPTFIVHFSASIDLYFRSFEFNASVYYVVREIGSLLVGYNLIGLIGPSLFLLSALSLLYFWWKQVPFLVNDALKSSLYALSTYYILATTVHPWYISMLLMLGILSARVYPVIWTMAAFLSYFAYQTAAYEESYWLIAFEYALVALAFARPIWLKQWLSSAR